MAVHEQNGARALGVRHRGRRWVKGQRSARTPRGGCSVSGYRLQSCGGPSVRPCLCSPTTLRSVLPGVAQSAARARTQSFFNVMLCYLQSADSSAGCCRERAAVNKRPKSSVNPLIRAALRHFVHIKQSNLQSTTGNTHAPPHLDGFSSVDDVRMPADFKPVRTGPVRSVRGAEGGAEGDRAQRNCEGLTQPAAASGPGLRKPPH